MKSKVEKLCKENNVKLLYLTKFGSHLYGTSTSNSDTDYKGIFLPSKEQCFLGKASKAINFSTKTDGLKNTKEDMDIQLWSLQYFLHLVQKGETNALDLLYSYTYPEMCIYRDSCMQPIFDNHDQLYDIRNCNAYIGYALGQAKKYGIKGSRLGKLIEVYNYITQSKLENSNKLSVMIPFIIKLFFDSSYCFQKEINGVNSLVLCGKIHNETITIEEFKSRLKISINKYGERAELARQNKGIDWKALSHAVRSLYQMEELIDYGKIQYPLNDASFLLKVKLGECSFDAIEVLINDYIEKLKNKLNNIKSKKANQELISNIILDCYK